VRADAEGNWKALLKPMPPGGPYIMKISSGKNELVYEDVMLGEVWICSGQSNMEFQLKNAYGYKFEQQHAGEQPIRQFDVPKKIDLQPEKDLSGGKWVKADSNTVGNFTAVGYFFAERLARELHLTVGLINSNWGGTQVEDWISRDAMLASPELGAVAKTLPENWDELKARVDRQLKEYAYKKGPVVNYTAEQLAAQPATFFEPWQKANVPGAWEWTGKLYSYRGEGFTQHTIKLDNSYANHKSLVSLGPIEASLAIYINGKLIQHDDKPGNLQLEVPSGAWKGGDNSLLIRLMAERNDPSRYNLSWNGTGSDYFVRFADTTISLADGNWHTMPDLSKPYHFDFLPNNTAFALYNTMVNPLIPYGIAGVIWYQGESNADRAYQYRTSFPLMITDWRNKWHREFPFLFVQLASFGSMQGSDSGSDWAELREAQTMALQLPNTGMTVTTDVGDQNNIHPRDKADVGARLASKALSMVYQLPGFYESPLFSSVDFSNGSAFVSFVHTEHGLSVKDKYGYIKGFELAGADHKFYYAQAIITGGNKVKVWCSQVPHPESVRYGWTNAPVEANLFSKEGFPVSPFRSDNWKGITDDKKFE
ncbi:MAG: sialate O-acetylesterase, partial [Bacteroidota bacterium]|nr:sialate O-acetylesterase [Bacteroidota bacterium]